MLSATINPNGTSTTYGSRREWGTCQEHNKEDECAGTEKIALEKPHALAAGNEPDSVTIKLRHLTPDCTYEVFLQATNASGKTESARLTLTTTGKRKSNFCEH